MERTRAAEAAVLGGTLALGLVLAGFIVGGALAELRAGDRTVEVKGFAEREVPADLALWPVAFQVTANDLQDLQTRVEASAGRIGTFLAARGFGPDEYARSSPRITDFAAQPGVTRTGDRYLAEATVTVRSGKVEAVREAIEESGSLVREGVALVRNWEQGTTFLFTGLNRIKPEMIAEATRDARRAAEQFAADSGSRVGRIRRAQQGYFSIEDRDPFSPEQKRIRVVTTVHYALEDR